MGRDQDHGITIVDADVTPPAALRDHDLALVMSGRRSNENKLGGPEDDWFDRLFASVDPDGRPTVDHVVLEADGARRRNVKAPAPHEPVIPARTTHVIVVIGADALDRVIEDQAHRPMRVAAAAGCSPYDRLTADRAARLLTHPDLGGRKDVPTDAWFGVLISKVGPAEQRVADDLAAILRSQAVPVHQVPLRPRP
jgi:molybdenum cofactor cytidylyltransferase